MTDAEDSDDERYANESFENESDAEVPEMSEFDSESSDNEVDDENDENLPSVKINTGPLKRNSYPNNITAVNKTDVVPFDSSSEEEDEVIVGQTLAEINTPSMLFEDEPSPPAIRQSSEDYEIKDSSEEISEEEEDEQQELKRIRDMEEKYLLQISAKTKETSIASSEIDEKKKQEKIQENFENETDDEEEEEDVPQRQEEYVFGKENEQECDPKSNSDSEPQDVINDIYTTCSSGSQVTLEDNNTESLDETKLVQLIQGSLLNLKVASSTKNEAIYHAELLHEIKTETITATGIINSEKIAVAIVQALKGDVVLKNFEYKDQNKILESYEKATEKLQSTDTDHEESANESTNNDNFISESHQDPEIVPHKDELEKESKDEVEKIQDDNSTCDDDQYIYYDARITSKTPTSFNSDDYIFHANFIQPFHRTNSIDKLRAKSHPRKSMSFSNERMREIERHNQILLRKILTQKPTYTLKSKSSQSSLEKITSQTNTRLTNSAVNRKKQQRQIDLDNQVLKRKIEAIALRRRPFIT